VSDQVAHDAELPAGARPWEVRFAAPCGSDGNRSLTSTEIFNPISGEFTDAGSMSVRRVGQSATLPADGQVLIAGGGHATVELLGAYGG
jgi:hypothetical protein